jgi:hypothetical protein
MNIFQYADINLNNTPTLDTIKVGNGSGGGNTNTAVQTDPSGTTFTESVQNTVPVAGAVTISTNPLYAVGASGSLVSTFGSDLANPPGTAGTASGDVALAYEWQFTLGGVDTTHATALITATESIDAAVGSGAGVPEPATPLLCLAALAVLGGTLLGRSQRRTVEV